MQQEETLVILKPDGMTKGLAGRLLIAIEKEKLIVTRHAFAHLTRTWVERLYLGEEAQPYFEDVVNWVSSAPVLLLKVEGTNAVDTIKWKVLGRYPYGIRGDFAENWIKNIAHAPDSQAAATRELAHAQEIFDNFEDKLHKRFAQRQIFALTGMSECGKSTAGDYFASLGALRLKIRNLFICLRDTLAPTLDLHAFVQREEERDPLSLWGHFLDALVSEMERAGAVIATIESLYGGGLAAFLRRVLGTSFLLLYIDAPLHIRLIRQMRKENLVSIEDAKRVLIPRDIVKRASGIPRLKRIATPVIDNSASVGDFHRQLRYIYYNSER